MTAAQAVCAGLAALLDRTDDGLRLVPHALGVRDELDPSRPPPGAGSAVPVLLYGRHCLTGPVPCATCLARRWQAVRQRDLRDALELGAPTQAAGASPYAVPFVADALAALAAAVGRPPGGPAGPGDATVYQLDLESLLVRRVGLVADPDCPHCGGRPDDDAPAAVDEAPAAVDAAPAPKSAPEAFRLRPVEDYGLAVDAYANPVCGALGPGLWSDLTSCSTAPAYGAFTLRTGAYLRETLYGGHSDSYRHSALTAVLEGLERAAGLRPRGRRTAVTGTLDEFGDGALDPRDCGVYSEDFYRANPHIHRFRPDRPIPWVWGRSLRDGRALLVPENLVYYHAGPVEERFVQETSNGCASGSSLVEAAYHGLMEVIERDAFLLAWYGRRRLPELDPATSARPRTRFMVDRLAMYGYRARFFDTRLTFDIPVVTAVAERRDGRLGTLAFGGGASLDPEAALAAALCEIATDAPMLAMRTGADEARLRAMAADFSKVYGLHDHPLMYGLPEMAHHADFLLGADTPGRRPVDTMAGVPLAADLRDDLEHCVKAVAAKGFDVIVVDQTGPEQRRLGVHTVCVLVPGLLPIDFGWLRQRAPHTRRLRTALRDAGRLDRDLRDDEINPAPHPFP